VHGVAAAGVRAAANRRRRRCRLGDLSRPAVKHIAFAIAFRKELPNALCTFRTENNGPHQRAPSSFAVRDTASGFTQKIAP
jgi:hypothetical protein